MFQGKTVFANYLFISPLSGQCPIYASRDKETALMRHVKTNVFTCGQPKISAFTLMVVHFAVVGSRVGEGKGACGAVDDYYLLWNKGWADGS